MRKYFRGSTTANAVTYQCGEEMTFDLTLVGEDGTVISVPLFTWTTTGDDGVRREGRVSGETGKITLTTSISKPGFVRVIVKACALDGTPLEGFDVFEGGAGAELDKIAQGVEDPDDYDEFWAGMRKTVADFTPELIEKVPVESNNPAFDAYDVKITSPANRPVSGYLTIPKNAAPGSCAIQLRFLGYGVASAPMTCSAGAVCLHLNPHGIENGREQQYYDDLRLGELRGFGFNDEENQSPETCYFRGMLLRGLTAAKFMFTLPEYDGAGLHLIGGSMGAMQATNVAANTENVADLEITVPWLCDLGGIKIGRQRGWRPNFTPAVRYFDTVAAASRVTCPVKIMCGLGDYVCPPSGEVVLWHNFKTEKSIRFVQNKTHPYNPPEIVEYVL